MTVRSKYEPNASVNLVPAAIVKVSPSQFRDMGVVFEYGEDDLEPYEFAAFSLPGGTVFGLLSYKSQPEAETTILLDDAIVQTSKIAGTLLAIAQDFNVPANSIHWQANGQPVTLMPESTPAAA